MLLTTKLDKMTVFLLSLWILKVRYVRILVENIKKLTEIFSRRSKNSSCEVMTSMYCLTEISAEVCMPTS